MLLERLLEDVEVKDAVGLDGEVDDLAALGLHTTAGIEDALVLLEGRVRMRMRMRDGVKMKMRMKRGVQGQW